MKRVKFVKVTEDWYPTYEDGYVHAFHCALPN